MSSMRLALDSRMLATAVTPFDEDGQVREDEVANQVKRIIAAGDQYGIPLAPVVNGEAGELYTLGHAERHRIIEVAVAAAGDRPVFAGVTGTTLGEVGRAVVAAQEAGARGLYLFPPSGGMSVTVAWDPVRHVEPLLDYLGAAMSEASVPVIMHPTAPFSARYGYGWPLETVRRVLDAYPEISGWKMMYPFEGYHIIAAELRARDVPVLATNGQFFHEYMASGVMDGACTGSWLYALEPMLMHLAAWQADDLAQARSIWHGLHELHRYGREDVTRGHLRLKLGAWLAGLIDSWHSREPVGLPTGTETRQLAQRMRLASVQMRPPAEVEEFARAREH